MVKGAHEFKRRLAQRAPLILGVSYLCLLAYGVLNRDYGLPTAWQLQSECWQMRDAIADEKKRSGELKLEIVRLRDEKRTIEKLAREDLKMVGPRELVVQFR